MSNEQERPTNVRWVVFGLACGASWLLYLHRYAFAVIKPELVQEWGLSKTELGLLDSAFSLTATLFQFPLGITADALGVRLVLTGLVLLWCLGLAMHAWSPSAAYLWYARATMGIGQSAVYACLSKMARSWFPASIRTTLQGIAGITAGRLGGACANLVFGLLFLGLLGLDWRTATLALAISGMMFGVLFAVVYRSSPRDHPLTNEPEVRLFAPDLTTVALANGLYPLTAKELVRRTQPRALGNLLVLNVQTILSTLADNIYSSWIPMFLWEVHELKFETMGVVMGIFSSLPLIGGAIAGFLGGVLNDFFIARTGNRRWTRSLIALVGKGAAAILLLVALAWYHNPYVFLAILFAVKFFGDWSLATSWGVVTDIGGRVTASVFAFNNAVAGIGFIAAPALFGFLADHYGWTAVFVSVAVTYGLCALSWLAIDCTIPMVEESQETSIGTQEH